MQKHVLRKTSFMGEGFQDYSYSVIKKFEADFYWNAEIRRLL